MLQLLSHFLPFHQVILSTYCVEKSIQARQDGSYSRAANYLTAMRSFITAVGDMPLRKVRKEHITVYQEYLKRQGISQNTISCYNRTLRAIYNKAVGERLTKDRQPFADVFTGRVKTTKRSVREDIICKIKAIDLRGNPQLERTRDYFLFSFYAMGMPFIDVAYLLKKQITGDMLFYDRRKTGSHVRVPLTDEALHLINIYSGETGASPYVFPILTTTMEPDAYDEYCTCLNTYNRTLKQLAKTAGINVNLTSYTARHSWASIAYRSDVSLHVISQALGHSKPGITMTYIRELDDEQLRMGNDKVQKQIKL